QEVPAPESSVGREEREREMSAAAVARPRPPSPPDTRDVGDGDANGFGITAVNGSTGANCAASDGQNAFASGKDDEKRKATTTTFAVTPLQRRYANDHDKWTEGREDEQRGGGGGGSSGGGGGGGGGGNGRSPENRFSSWASFGSVTQGTGHCCCDCVPLSRGLCGGGSDVAAETGRGG
ncbi:unnamed protein product, partial [Pylaiella littoralis]